MTYIYKTINVYNIQAGSNFTCIGIQPKNKKLCSMNLVSFPEPAFSQRKHKAVADLGGVRASLVPRPSPAPVFDRLQYAKTEPEGLVNLTT